MNLIKLIFLSVLVPSISYAWNQSINAIKIVPNDYWYNHCIVDSNGTHGDDPYHFVQWPWTDDYLNLPRAWSITTGDPSIVVVCADYDIHVPNPDLTARALISIPELNGQVGIDDDYDGNIDNTYVANGSSLRTYGYPPWYIDESIIRADGLTSASHGSRCFGSLVATTDNNIGIAGIDWKCKYSPLLFTGTTTEISILVNWVRHVKYALGYDVRFINASYEQAGGTSRTIKQLIDMGVLPIVAAGNHNNKTIAQADNDSILVVGSVNQDYLRSCSASGSSFGSNIDCVAYSGRDGWPYDWIPNYTDAWVDGPDIIDPTSSWRPDRYIPGAIGATEALAKARLLTISGSVMAPYHYWMLNNGVNTREFWDGIDALDDTTSQNWRAIAYLDDSNRPSWGTYDVDVKGVVFSTGLNSGAAPMAVGVGTLFCAHANANALPAPHPLSIRNYILRGCVSVNSYNSTALGGVNRCCADSASLCTTPNIACDGLLGAGRIDAYRTLTLWGRVSRDTTFQGDVYVSGDVLVNNDAVITIKGGTVFHVMPEDITHVDPWQPLIQYDPDGVADGDCRLASQLSGEESKIEIIFDQCTVNIVGGNYKPVRFESYAKIPTTSDWSQLVFTENATTSGVRSSTLLMSGATHALE